MRKKIAWLVVSCLMVLSLVLASCAQAVTEEKAVTEKKEVVTEEKAAPQKSVTTVAEAPKYGGTLVITEQKDTSGWDDLTPPRAAYPLHLVQEHPLVGDWAKGPAGTGQTTWTEFGGWDLVNETGALAESWELPDAETIIFHIRQGVRFHNKPPTSGREFTAEDLAYTINRQFANPTETKTSYGSWFKSATATDRYTVVIKGQETATMKTPRVFWAIADSAISGWPKDLIEAGISGKLNLSDWRNNIGTGPFMVTDHVFNSSTTLVRNPNYWMTDPVGPGKGNQLPYVDKISWLIIEDISTVDAALRTGKLDWTRRITGDDVDSILPTNPKLQYLGKVDSGEVIYLDVNKPKIPVYNVDVRRALSMAINREEMLQGFYGGKGEVLSSPIAPYTTFKNSYTPLEQLPESIKEIYTYNPTKAKQLLVKAGYPDGFKITIPSYFRYDKQLEIVKAYWAAIGVDLTIQSMEYNSYLGLRKNTSHDSGIVAMQNLAAVYGFGDYVSGGSANYMGLNDPYIDDRYAQIWSFENINKPDVQDKLASEVNLRILDQVYGIHLPLPFLYYAWQPWVKNLRGEFALGANRWTFSAYVWVDGNLKKSLGY